MSPIRSHSQALIAIVLLTLIQVQVGPYVFAQHAPNHGARANPNGIHQKCSRQSIILTRQLLTYELDKMNDYLSFWFNDLERDELFEEQAQSLSKMVMSGTGRKLLNSMGQPVFEIEASHFRLVKPSENSLGDQMFASEQNGTSSTMPRRFSSPLASQASFGVRPINLRLLRRHPDRCVYNTEKHNYNYAFGLAFGPFEHHLDIIYHLPKDLRISQPIGWRYAKVILSVPRMNYEILLKQSVEPTHHGLDVSGSFNIKMKMLVKESLPTKCPAIDIKEVIYLPQQGENLSISSQGLAKNNQTLLQLDRLFDDYTRPTVSQHLKQMLRFHLSSKTLPLNSAA